jgi:hypothetical protein
MTHAFQTCHAKLGRAREHLASLVSEQQEFLEARPFSVHGEFLADSGTYVFKVDEVADPPLRCSIIIGDVLQNTRSALDHLVWQLVLLNDDTPGKQNQFPICSTEKQYRSAAKKQLRGVGKQAEELIDAFQPYRAGHDPDAHPLARLRDLSNADKHKIVHTTFSWLGDPELITTVTFESNIDAGPVHDQELLLGQPLVPGATIAHATISPIGPNPRVEMRGRLPFELAFDSGRMVRHTIADAAIIVHQLVNQCGALYGLEPLAPFPEFG